MADNEEMAMMNGNASTSNEPETYHRNGDTMSHPNNSNIRLRKDMNLLPIPIKIPKEKLLNAHGPRYQTDSLERFCPSNRMPRMYAYFGYFVGLHPFKFIMLGFLISSLSLGMYYVRLQDNVRDGYTPTTSRARKESDVLRSFMNSTIDPVTTTIMFRARDGGSMHRLKYLQEVVRIAKFLNDNLTVPYQTEFDGPIKECKFSDICGAFCNSHYFVRSFAWSLEEQINRYKAGKALNPRVNLTYPIGKTEFLQYHMEGNFFGVKMREENDTRPLPTGIVPITNYSYESVELSEAKAVSYIDFVELIMLVFRGDFLNPGDEARARAWEMGAYKYLRNEFKNDLIEPLALGNDIVDFELKEDGKRMTPFFIVGFGLTICFVIFTVIMDSIVEKVMDSGKLIVALVLIICPGLSITTTFGIFGLLDQRINSVTMIMPFLIMGIGVNDAFLMLHAWHRTSINRISIPQRMGLIMEDVGPSITITTVTDVTTFILGSLTPTAEISLFCRTTAVALTLCYLFTLLLFLPILCYCSRLENPNSAAVSRDPNGRAAKLERLYDKVSVAYCKWIMHPATGLVVILMVVSFLGFSIIGFIKIDAKLDTEKILPYDSPIKEPHELIAHKVWIDYYPVSVFVNKPLDLGNQDTMDRLNQMVNDFESMSKCKGKQFTHLWTRDYENFRKSDFFFESFLPSDSSSNPSTTTLKPSVKSRPYFKKIRQFLSNVYNTHYSAFLQLDFSHDIPVRKFWFTVTYHNTTSWDERIELMLNLREVADRYEDLDVSVWEINGMFVDQMLSLKWLTYYNGLVTLICMFIMCIFFISQWFLICLAVLSIASITIEVIGCLSWWGLDLDPVTLAACLMSIGMSVDFTAHIAYHLKLNDILRVHDRKLYRYELESNQHKVIGTLEAVGWPTVQAGASTVICVLPLVFLQNYIPLVFVKTILLVVICGLVHGLVVMPSVFSLSWQCLIYMRKVFGCNHHEGINRHIHSSDVLPPRRGDSLDQRERQSQSFSYSNLLLSAGQTEKQDLLPDKPNVAVSNEYEDSKAKESMTGNDHEKLVGNDAADDKLLAHDGKLLSTT